MYGVRVTQQHWHWAKYMARLFVAYTYLLTVGAGILYTKPWVPVVRAIEVRRIPTRGRSITGYEIGQFLI